MSVCANCCTRGVPGVLAEIATGKPNGSVVEANTSMTAYYRALYIVSIIVSSCVARWKLGFFDLLCEKFGFSEVGC